MFYALHDLCSEYRGRGYLSFISLYVKGIRSSYLSLALRNENAHCCEILLYLGVKPDRMTDQALEEMVARIDAFCVEMGALRYMHTRTVGVDDPVRKTIDPNARVKPATDEADTGPRGGSTARGAAGRQRRPPVRSAVARAVRGRQPVQDHREDVEVGGPSP
jgi:hypothetical protein